MYVRLSWEQAQVLCPPPFTPRHNRNPNSLFIKNNFLLYWKTAQGTSKWNLPRTDSVQGIWNWGWVRGRVLWLQPKPVGGSGESTCSPGHSISFTIWFWSLPSTHIGLAHTAGITWGITLAESYLLWTLVIISCCPQERMRFFTRTNCSSNKQNKSHNLERSFYFLSAAAAGQSRREGRFDLGELT